MKKSFIALALALLTALSIVPATAFAAEPAAENKQACARSKPDFKDHGPEPFVEQLARLTKKNPNFRTAIWTGKELQLTVMSIPKGGEVGLEMHDDTDQFLYVVEGTGAVQMGAASDKLTYSQPVEKGSGIFVPVGTWHNITNSGDCDLKLFTVYAPPHHPHGTVQATKEIADSEE